VDSTTTSSIAISWTDNSNNETGFKIERKKDGGTWSQIAEVGADVTALVDNGLDSGTTYHYRVRAYNTIGNSDHSNEATGETMLEYIPLPFPEAPANLEATAASSAQIDLTWDDVASETGYKLERKNGGSWALLITLGPNSTSFADTGLTPETTYEYRILSYNLFGDSAYSDVTDATTLAEEATPPDIPEDTVTIRFYIDSQAYYVNDVEDYMDTSPVILDGRTLLPIRYVAQPLGADTLWNGSEQKVTITMGSTVIEMWIGNNEAKVNGATTQIDPGNPSVTPIILDGRTMLPIRFVSENLNCDVNWNGALQEVEVVHPAAP
jgi:titin